MKAISLLLLLSLCQPSFSQDYEIRDISNKEYHESGALSSGEIQIINYANSSMIVNCSINKKTWVEKRIKIKDGIEVSVTNDVEFFYIKYCNQNTGSVTCDTYKLRPGKRYVFRYSEPNKTIELKKTDD